MEEQKEDPIDEFRSWMQRETIKRQEMHGGRTDNEIEFFLKFGFYLPKWMIPIYLILASLQEFFVLLIVILAILYGLNMIFNHPRDRFKTKVIYILEK